MPRPVLSVKDFSDLTLRQLQDLRQEMLRGVAEVERAIESRPSFSREPAQWPQEPPSGRACGRTHRR